MFDWAALGKFFTDVGPLLIELYDAYKEGKLQQYKEALINAKTAEERKAVRQSYARRLYDK